MTKWLLVPVFLSMGCAQSRRSDFDHYEPDAGFAEEVEVEQEEPQEVLVGSSRSSEGYEVLTPIPVEYVVEQDASVDDSSIGGEIPSEPDPVSPSPPPKVSPPSVSYDFEGVWVVTSAPDPSKTNSCMAHTVQEVWTAVYRNGGFVVKVEGRPDTMMTGKRNDLGEVVLVDGNSHWTLTVDQDGFHGPGWRSFDLLGCAVGLQVTGVPYVPHD